MTVNKVASISVTFSVTPADATVNLQDSFGDRIWPVNGAYSLLAGADYSYTVTKNGYIGQKNSFQLTQSGVVEIALEQAPANESIDETIYAQWGSFRGENNLGITEARTPYDPEEAELLWAARYGSGWSSAPGSPILVDGDIVTYIGSTIKRLDRNTGEIVAEGTMAGSSSFSIVPATYAAGMIFVGLSNGRIQAFNAETLESLWLYTQKHGLCQKHGAGGRFISCFAVESAQRPSGRSLPPAEGRPVVYFLVDNRPHVLYNIFCSHGECDIPP